MIEWKEIMIGDLVTLQRGHDLVQTDFIDGPYPVAGSNGLIGYHNQYTTEGPGLTIGRSGNSIGVAHYYSNSFWAHNTVLYSKQFHGSYPLFVYYLLKSHDFKSMDGGSAVPTLNRNHVHPILVKVPADFKEQKSIAEVLSSLDDKIDLLHRQNKTLEQLAETLFRQWFVEEAEESWANEYLGNLFEINIGRTPPRKENQWFSKNSSDVKWVSIKDMGNSGIYIDTVSECLTRQAIEQFKIPLIPANTVILSFKLTIGRVAITTDEMISNEAIAHFKLKPKTKLYPEFLYLLFKSFNFGSLGSTSSIAEAVNSQMIKEIEIKIPDDNKLIDFRMTIEPMFYKIKSNSRQIKTLAQLRDTLLSKLMNGEVRVKM